jgi:hypothetical protein
MSAPTTDPIQLLHPEISAALAAADVTVTKVPPDRVVSAGGAGVRTVAFDADPPKEGIARFVITHDPNTDQVHWATPVEGNKYRVVVPESGAPGIGHEGAGATPTAWSHSLLEMPLTLEALMPIEAAVTPHALWAWTETTYHTDLPWSDGGHRGNKLGPQFWGRGPRALAVLHGFLDRGPSCFGSSFRGGLLPDQVRQLRVAYHDQTFAFDRPTVLSSPEDNVEWLLDQLDARIPKAPLTLDLLCHSQGGLVARALATHADELEDMQITIGRIVFVATPNEGTPLTSIDTDESSIDRKLLDVYVKIFKGFAEKSATGAISWILQLLTHPLTTLAQGSGVQAMCPKGTFLTKLNQAKPTFSVVAVTSRFERAAGERILAQPFDEAEQVAGPVFGGQPNDIIVPTAGVAAPFEHDDLVELDPRAQVHHWNYFANKDTQKAILGSLPPPAPAAVITPPASAVAAHGA